MDRYTIYCTKVQTKKALELGAPIKTDIDEYGDIEAFAPTAEQMIGWLEEQKDINEIELIKSLRGWVFAVYTRGTLLDVEDTKVTYYPTRKEATLTAIDAALDYLIKNK